MDEALIQRVVARIREDQQQGRSPAEISVPDEKSAFPKILCLDMNKWVDLSRAHYQRPDGQPFLPALEAVRKAVAAGKLVVPITSMNLAESSEPEREDRRERLARFMVELSSNHSMMWHDGLLEAELYGAVQRLFLAAGTVLQFRHTMVQRGITAALGREFVVSTGQASMDALVNEALRDAEVTVYGMVNAVSRDTIKAARAMDDDLAQVVSRVRETDADKTTEERRRLEAGNVFTSGKTAEILRRVLTELSVDADEFFRWLATDENALHFCNEAPSLDVKLTLALHRDKNPGCEVKPNDGKDLTFLGVAVPYANIVVAEKHWGHIVRVTRLDAKYHTAVLARTSDLPEMLTKEGCIA